MTTVVEMTGIVKTFPGVIANRSVDFQLEEGEIHALLGENGAGKTTLMNVLYGLYHPDDGIIKVNGKGVRINSPRDAISLGVGMVHQHFKLVPRFTVAENFLLGAPSSRPPLLEDIRQVCAKILHFSEEFNLEVDPTRPVWQLSVGTQQRVEILKSLYRGAQILILDEPTAVLTPPEVDQLEGVLETLISANKSIVFITHKLEEVMKMSHRITVMRDGSVVGTLLTENATREETARLMVGRDIQEVKSSSPNLGASVLEINSLNIRDDRGLQAVKDLSLEIKAGEILGIAGVDGNGQIELEEALMGLRPTASGKVLLEGKDITSWLPDTRRKSGIAHIPSDRYRRGIIPSFTVAENLVLGHHKNKPFSRGGGILNPTAITNTAERLVKEFQIRTPSITTHGSSLSGGNAQRLILARELDKEPKTILACQPTRGLDVGAIENVHQRLLNQRDQGVAILLISAELEEILMLCDRIAVIYEGEIMGIIPRSDANVETLGLMMCGSCLEEVRSS
jgi:general nucleoside transport system ATP-binding protein